MNILLTQYVYPLEKEVCFSKTHNLYLDNPRSEEELEWVMKYIKESNENGPASGWAPNNSYFGSDQYITIESTIIKFFKKNHSDNYVVSFAEDADYSDTYKLLAKMWIILRYPSDALSNKKNMEKYQKNGEANRNSIPFVKHKDYQAIAVDYCSLFALLLSTPTEDNKRTILLPYTHFPDRISDIHPFAYIFIHFMVGANNNSKSKSDKPSSYNFNKDYIKIIEGICSSLDIALQDILNNEKLMAVASLLNSVKSFGVDYRLIILSLVSIIEMLITHCPDYNRFNIEDSINKQFQLKVALVLYFNDNSICLDSIKEKLKIIYSLRSKIAHGDFVKKDKTMRKIYNLYKYKIKDDFSTDYDLYYSYIISDLYNIIKVILQTFLSDSSLINFIKNS